MSKIKLSLTLLVFLLLSVGNKTKAQFEIDPIYYYQFSEDSLVGFDENAARASAISEQFLGAELKIKMYRLKREYIDNKYGIIRPMPVYNTTNYLTANRPSPVPGCTNEDFEASTPAAITTSNQIAGWTVSAGYNGFVSNTSSLIAYYPGGLQNASSCNLLGCCPMPPSNSALIDCSAPGGFVDNVIGSQYPIYSVFGTGTVSGATAANPQISNGLFGTKILRLNDSQTGDYSIEKLSKTFAVTSSNALFQFAFISVFSPGHGCCDAGGFQIRLTNASTNSIIPCPNFSVSAPSSQCTGTVPVNYLNVGSGTTYTPNVNFGNIYHPWKVNSMDLSAYIGQNITIDIITSDCTAGGHYGYIYFDAQCGPMTVYGNGNAYDAGTNVTVPTCGASGATICAADGLGPYSWSGPGLTLNQTTPSMTNQCITTSVSAQFTLYMQPAGSCAPIQRIVNSTITPAPLLNISALQAVCGSTLATVSATPSGSAANPSSLSWSPSPLTLNSNTTIGTYAIPSGTAPILVTVTGSDPLGCVVVATVNVNPAPPIPSFSIMNVTNSSSITCDHPAINLNAVTNYNYNNGTLNYFWASASTTLNTNPVSITNPGSYTVNAVDPVTQCGTVSIVSIGVNTVAPLSTISPSFQNITCSLSSVTEVTTTASPSVNVTHQILSPQGGTFSASSFSTVYTPGGTGTFTYCLKDDVNGCSTCKTFTVASNQGFPTFSVVSAQNFTLGCNSTSCAIVNITLGNTNPPGGAVSYSLLTPSTGTATAPGPLSGISNYTICAPGTYTVVTKDNASFCETRTPISILSNTFAPDISAIVERQILDCNNPKVTLRGQSTNTNVSHSWSFPGTPNTQPGDTITVSANTAASNTSLVANYTLTIQDNSSTCKSFSVIPVYQNLYAPKPVITNGGVNSLSCKTPTVMLTNLSITNIPPGTGYPTNQQVIGFLWEGPSPQEPLSNSSTYLGQTIGTYTLTAKDLNNGCTSKTITTITDERIYPTITFTNPVFYVDCGQATTTLQAFVVGPYPQTAYQYTWTGPPNTGYDPSPFVNPTKADLAGEYGLLVVNTINGCASITNTTVINGKLTADFEPDVTSGYAPLTVNFINKSVSSNTLTASNNIRSYWSFSNGSSKTYTSIESTSTVFNQPGTYTVTLFATKGDCQDSKQRIIKVEVPSSMVIPNVFTPNGDGVNDLFFLKASNLSSINAVIFDRWGHKVFDVTSEKGNVEWDGKNQFGKEVAEGTYFYLIKAIGKDNQSYDYKGTISLYR